MDHKQLRAFLTIAETGNMTRAAELLSLVQPAVSRQLRMLEDDIVAFEPATAGPDRQPGGQADVPAQRAARHARAD